MKPRTSPATDITDVVKRLFGWKGSALLVRASLPVRHLPRRRSSC
ncbi:MAG TPA: hypothetical protein VHX44_01585 [Planctomycetota bacterium]|nr:hypothetical protein [Planctomycetota bacterium]